MSVHEVPRQCGLLTVVYRTTPTKTSATKAHRLFEDEDDLANE